MRLNLELGSNAARNNAATPSHAVERPVCEGMNGLRISSVRFFSLQGFRAFSLGASRILACVWEKRGD